MQDDANKRYSEPKRIGEIMTDIGMGKEDIECRKPMSTISKKFAKLILKNLAKHNKLIDRIDTEHLNLAGVIDTMEEFYEEQKGALRLYTTLANEKGIDPKIINTNVHNAQIKLETFSKIVVSLTNKLKNVIDKIPYKEDKHIQKQRVDEFLVFFRSECADITDIIANELQLVQKLKRK